MGSGPRLAWTLLAAASLALAAAGPARVWLSEAYLDPGNFGDLEPLRSACGPSAAVLVEATADPRRAKAPAIELASMESNDTDLTGWYLVLSTAPDGQELFVAPLPSPLVLAARGTAALRVRSKGKGCNALGALTSMDGSVMGASLTLKRPDHSMASRIGPGVPRWEHRPHASSISRLHSSGVPADPLAASNQTPPHMQAADQRLLGSPSCGPHRGPGRPLARLPRAGSRLAPRPAPLSSPAHEPRSIQPSSCVHWRPSHCRVSGLLPHPLLFIPCLPPLHLRPLLPLSYAQAGLPAC